MATNGAQPVRHAKPPPTGPTPPAPTTAPPAPPNNTQANVHASSNARQPNGVVNGTHAPAQKGKKKAADPPPVDPSQMYETLKNRIAALEEEEVHEEEEERKFTEEAQSSMQGLDDNAVHQKYIELFAELKRMERDHAKEKQKLVKDKDAAKSQLTKANQTKTKMENLARELQKDNKRLREDSKRLAQCVEEAQEEIMQMKNDMAKRAERVKVQDTKYRDMPDIVVKVVCKYRAELFFKISRKTKLAKLFSAWTDRMEGKKEEAVKIALPVQGQGQGVVAPASAPINGNGKTDGVSLGGTSSSSMQFIFSYGGRTLEADQTPEEAGMEDGDEILAVEMMDLTEGPGMEDVDDEGLQLQQKLRKNWQEDPREARKVMEDIFDGVVRERLKEVLRQYELRERHFECVIRSKELEVLLSRARAAEQKQLAANEKDRAGKAEEECRQLQQDVETLRSGRTQLIDDLIQCCKEPSVEGAQYILDKLHGELEGRGTELANGPVGG